MQLTFPDAGPQMTQASHRPTNMAQMLDAMKALRAQPVISLATALEQLRLLERNALAALQDEDPDLLRNKSAELVRRFLITPEGREQALARTAGLVEVDTANFELDPATRDLLPVRTLRALDCLLLGSDNGLIYVASWSPTDEVMQGRLTSLLARHVMMVWGERQAIESRLSHQDPDSIEYRTQAAPPQRGAVPYPAAGEAGRPAGPALPVLPADLQDMASIVHEVVRDLASGRERETSTELHESSSIVRMIKRMVIDAHTMNASDIHIEANPGDQVTRIRLRRDGDMHAYQELPSMLQACVVSRVKVMAQLGLSPRHQPQEGRIRFARADAAPLELRVVIIPTHDGMEDAVLRLPASPEPIALEHLGLHPRDVQTIARMSARSFGLVLAVGPSASGKTSLLHAMLAQVNSEERKIWTVEDPVEIVQPGLRQVQVDAGEDVTFASAMRGFLHADPDIIMVGETRDAEVARLVVDASLTGRLVLTALNCGTAAEGVVRMLTLGIEPQGLADALVGVVAHRLVRALCPLCACERPLRPSLFADLVREYVHGSPLTEQEGALRLLGAAGVRLPQELRFKVARGCEQCGGTGYAGRLGVYEVLKNGRDIRPLVQRRATASGIHDESVRAGMRSLRHDALEKWLQGLVDLRQARAAYL